MTKNKKKQKQAPAVGAYGDVQEALSQSRTQSPASTIFSPDEISNNATASSLPSRAKAASIPPMQGPQGSNTLVICRNKHWRYISSFHGPWLQLPPEIMEFLAHQNYNHPLPRPIDPAVFYDLLKIRRLVEDATDLAVRAASGLVSLKNLDNSHQAAALGLGFGGGKQPMLSAERRHKLREQATQKLARAYRLDEIACSVSTMQSASSLEDVASLVLRRDPHSLDAKYVHFFHEKIPSRQMAESTSLDALDELIACRPSECEALRTRASIKVFKEDYRGAVQDLTEALNIIAVLYRHRSAEARGMELQHYERNGRRADVVPDEDQQPSSLQAQLLFARAGILLTLACINVGKALDPVVPGLGGAGGAGGGGGGGGGGERGGGGGLGEEGGGRGESRGREGHARGEETSGQQQQQQQQATAGATGNGKGAETSASVSSAQTPHPPPPELTAEENSSEAKIWEARKAVKMYAKKALRDLMSYLSNFHYSPDFPAHVADEYARKVMYSKSKTRWPASNGEQAYPPLRHTVYKLSELFVATPPTGLPDYSPSQIALVHKPLDQETYLASTTEMATYHPLLSDALHSVLLCHVLMQTSPKELQRHAHMVARISRLGEGHPMFHSSRSPARSDWVEILRQCQNWIGLAASWDYLCSPASLLPLPLTPTEGPKRKALPPFVSPEAAVELEEMSKEEAIHLEAARRALEDDRVNDQHMFRVAYQAHRKTVEAKFRAQQDRRLGSGAVEGDEAADPVCGSAPSPQTKPTATLASRDLAPSFGAPASLGPLPGAWPPDDGREYPLLTQRALAVSLWQQRVPRGAGGTGSASSKKKKKGPSQPPAGPGMPGSASAPSPKQAARPSSSK